MDREIESRQGIGVVAYKKNKQKIVTRTSSEFLSKSEVNVSFQVGSRVLRWVDVRSMET
jgi:hypothetical protein